MVNPLPGEKKRKLAYSMMFLAGLLGAAVVLTAYAASYFRGQDPVNQCITDPMNQPFQISVPVEVFEDRIRSTVRDVGLDSECIRPVHTLVDNEIHVAYERPHDFTLGHFFYFWLGDDILRYDTKVYVNDSKSTGDFRDIVLVQGDRIRIELTTRN
jgi:hypothetical protein